MDNTEPFAENHKEPFAKVELAEATSNSDIGLLFNVIVAGQYMTCAKYERATALANMINAAHEAAVRESVKKAVAPLRAELKRLDFVFNRERIGRNRAGGEMKLLSRNEECANKFNLLERYYESDKAT